MKKIRSNNQHYDAWLHWDVTKRCNLDCEYCFGKITDPSVKVNSIDIESLMTTIKATGKIFRISFTGGEPTMVPNFIQAVKAITEKHFVSFNTNLITKNLLKIIGKVDPKRILHIHASLHYDELTKNNLLATFINNFKLLQKNGFNIYAEAVAYPSLNNRVHELESFLKLSEIIFEYAPFYGKFENKIYPESYTKAELKLFNLSDEDIGNFIQKGEPCIAGYNAAVVFSNGDIYPCHQIKEKMGNIYNRINLYDELVHCSSKKCGCPLNIYDDYLFEKSIAEIENQTYEISH